MSVLKSYGTEVNSVFQLLGYKENSITASISWALCKCPQLLSLLIECIFSIKVDSFEEIEILNQEYNKGKGITDIEIKGKTFHIIIEAKRGWNLPKKEQLIMYSQRETFKMSSISYKAIITM